jgi:hypothetical protein
MNASSVRPHTKLAAALVAAGVVSAAAITGVPENRALPVLNIDVAKTSVITDVLEGFGDAVNGVASGLAWIGDGAASLPFDATYAIAVAAQDPSSAPNVLSWLVQRYVNPSINYPNFTYPYQVKVDSIEPLAALLPSALGDAIINGVNGISDAINDALAVLPGAIPDSLVDQFQSTDIGRLVLAANLAATAPGWMLYSTAYYLGYLPADLEATFESAIQDPSEIPGLVSNLVYGLLSPSGSLFGDLLFYASQPLTTLPGPIGELATNAVNAIADSVDNLLSLLPTPISPTPFPSALKVADPTDVPDASLAVGGATLLSVDPVETVEKKVEAPDSTENTPPVTPQDPAPAADDVDPAATPPADTDAPEVKADPVKDPAKDPVKSGNKVSPGDKFDNQTKGGKGKDDTVKDEGSGTGTTATTPDTVDATPGDTTDPTGTPAGPTGGAEHSDPSDASGAAA